MSGGIILSALKFGSVGILGNSQEMNQEEVSRYPFFALHDDFGF